MNRPLAEKIADAVLYEGYMLYPYRRSAIKNQQRWSFGILYPPAYDEVRAGTERPQMHSECILVACNAARLHVQLRFLHLLTRQVMSCGDDGFVPVQSMLVDGTAHESWDEGQERTIDFDLVVDSVPEFHKTFRFPATHNSEPVCDANGVVAGLVDRTQREVKGTVTVVCQNSSAGHCKITIDIINESNLPASADTRDEAILQSMLSAHLILSVERGEFVSLLDPPEQYSQAVKACKNVGNLPVLVGNDGERDMMLCSPILLYDYPQIAPESTGDFFDATEMDEMLTLRVMTLTDAEKSEVRSGDSHARKLLERTEQTVREQLQRTHGIIRDFRAVGDGHE